MSASHRTEEQGGSTPSLTVMKNHGANGHAVWYSAGVIATTNDLLGFLQSHRLLSAEQFAALAREAPPPDARAGEMSSLYRKSQT